MDYRQLVAFYATGMSNSSLPLFGFFAHVTNSVTACSCAETVFLQPFFCFDVTCGLDGKFLASAVLFSRIRDVAVAIAQEP